VIRSHVNVAYLHPLGAHLLQKPGGGNFALANHRARHLRSQGWRQLAQQKVLEDAAGALHCRGELLIADFENICRDLLQAGGGSHFQRQFHAENNPFLMLLEDALAIAELALPVLKDPYAYAVEKPHGMDALRYGMPVRPGVAINRGAHPSGYAGKRLEPLESPVVGEIHQVLKHRARAGRHARAGGLQGVLHVAQHQAAEALVGDDQVGAAACNTDRRAALPGSRYSRHERRLIARLREEVRRAADGEPGIAGERGTGANS